jgi:cell division protein FtsI (penicillin-binding protein 3)
MTVLLAVMVARVAQLQLAPSPDLSRHVQARIAKRTIAAPRGDIVDRRYRPIASSQFGWRVFVDPTELPTPPDEAIARLADTIGAPADVMGGKILTAMEKNRERLAAAAADARSGPPAAESGGISGLFSRLLALGRADRAAPAAARAGVADAGDAGVDGAEGEPGAPAPRGPIRYVRVSDVLSDATIDAVKRLKIAGVHLERRSVRDYPAGALAASIIGKVNVDNTGVLGAEKTHEEELAGDNGRILYVRDALGRPLWMGPGAYDAPRRGGDLRLSIDLEVQRIATEELERGVEESDAAGGRLVVMDPATGEVMAMVDLLRPVPDAVAFPWPDARPAGARRSGLLYEPPPVIPRARYIVVSGDPDRERDPALARNRCVEDIYEPGSTFKPFTWATITELGLVKPGEVIATHNGFWVTPYGRRLHDVHAHDFLSWEDVLVQSSNIGMAQGAERMSFDQMYSAIRRFGFGSRTGIGLPGETAGMVTPRRSWSKYTQDSVAFGQEVGVTPVQMVRAFSAFARSGDLAGTLPPVRLTAVESEDAQATVIHRVLRRSTVTLVRSILRKVVDEMEAKMASNKDHPETGWRYAMFGKSGTAQIPLGKAPPGKRRPPGMGFYERQYRASFIAAGPAEDPKLVVLAVIEDPGPELVRHRAYFGSQTAGPVVRRVMERALAYLGALPSPDAGRPKANVGTGSLSD